MKKIFTLLALAIAVFNFKAVAQPNTACHAQFTYTISGNSVHFTPIANANDSNIYRTWDFGDNNASQFYTNDTASQTHIYFHAGTYHVVSKITRQVYQNGSFITTCQDSAEQDITIANTIPCELKADFSYKADSLYSNILHFNSPATLLPGYLYSVWSFNDNTSIDYSYNPVHTFYASGSYNVCLKVYSTSGCSDSICKTVQVKVPTNLPCNAAFSYVVSNNNVQFKVTDTSSVLAYNIIDFGDGYAAYYPNVSSPLIHTYNEAGVYHVQHTIYKYLPDYSTVICRDSVIETVTVTSVVCNIHAAYSFTRDSIQSNIIHFKNNSTAKGAIDYIRWYFGDSTYSSDYNPTHTFAKSGLYHVCLLVKNDSLSNCGSDTCMNIQVQVPVSCNLQAYFNSTTDSLHPNTINFHNYTSNLSNSDSSYWDFGDNTTSRNANPTHAYTQPGTYNVCLTVTRITTSGTAPCTSKFCRTIVIQPACNLTADFTYYRDSLAPNLYTYHFTNTSTPANGFDSSYWSFGDGTSSYDKNPIHAFTTPGTYTVCLYVKKAITSATSPACESHICETVMVTAVCNTKAAYTWKVDSLNHNTIYFTNATIPIVTNASVRWSFGDGSALDSTWNTKHTYAQAGKYYVCLRIQISTNCVSYQCDSVTVPTSDCNIKPDFTWKVDSLNHNKINFTNTTITTVAGATARWFFGDGTYDSTWNTAHTFAQPGKYYVCLRVQTTSSCYKYQCDSITVPSATVCNLQAYFYGQPDSLQYNKIHFTNYTTNLSATDSSYWEFGDGATAHDASPTHVYAKPGTYTTCLTVTRITTPGAAPCVSKFCRTIVVTAPCNLVVDYSYIKDSISSSPNTYHFTNLSMPLSNTDSVYWNFGDGTTSKDINPTHVFTQSGTYTICLYITKLPSVTNTSCTGHICKTIVITQPCDFKIGYTFALDSINHNKVYFTNTSNTTTASANIRWSFGDGSPLDSTWNTTHVFSQPGKYYVCLRIQTSVNCVKYLCDSITIPSPYTDCNNLSLFTVRQFPADAQSYNFVLSHLNTDVQYTWTFGDNTGTRDATTAHRYNPGNYIACLTAYRNNNCASTSCKTITVTPQLNCDSIQLSYTYYKDGGVPNKVYFYTASNSSVSQQIWTIRHLSNTADSAVKINQANPTYIFNDTGYYNICLRAEAANGCIKEYCNDIHIDAVAASCELQAYPNPAQNQVSVNVPLDSPQMIYAYVYDIQSVLLLQNNQQGNTGTNMITINTQNLSAGFYTIKLIYGNRACFAKFQKM